MTPAPAKQRATVTITVLDRQVTVPEDTTLLNAVRAAGHPELLGCGCRLGDCGECRIAVRHPGNAVPSRELSCVVNVVAGDVVVELPFPWTRAFRHREARG